MPLSEFDIIQCYFNRQSLQRNDVMLGIGDDAALITPPAGQQLAIAIDTLVEGVHFPIGTAAYDIGWKALAVNLSDMAAMGAEPAWFTLAFTLEKAEEHWLEAFSQGLLDLATRASVLLVGGDTTRGPLTVTIQIAGYVPEGEDLTRHGAKPGDEIWVSGTLGDAALGLQLSAQPMNISKADRQYLLQRLNRPLPQHELGMSLRHIASSCIDISDGLLADLGHLCETSQVGAIIEFEAIPLSAAAKNLIASESGYRELPLYGGDDYELCFTAAPDKHDQLLSISRKLDCPLTCIGQITAELQVRCQDSDGRIMALPSLGYQHFGDED